MKGPLNVVHLIQGLEIGGLEMMVVNLVEQLDRAHYRPAVCCYDTLGSLAERLTSQGTSVALVRRKPGVDLGYILRLARCLRQSGANILHLHNPTAFFYGTLAGKLARIPCIVYTEHGRDFSLSRKVRLANRVLSTMVDKVVAVAEFGKRYLVAEEGVSPARVVTIHNGIDGQRFGPHYDRDAVRASLGLAGGQPVVGIVARLDAIKNHAGLLRAMQCVAAELPSAVLLVVGDGPLRCDLESLAAGLGLGTVVRFLGARHDVPELLSAMDLFVLSSHSEGLSLTLVEASAAGRPIVATDVGGNAEVVEHGVTGLIVPADDPEALSRAMLAVLTDPVKARRMGEEGRIRFEQGFTLEAMVREYEELYASCTTW
ncbi:MAG TPA: GT4 family glycosyltransferase PelF [Gammaproteobacteria bacterium]|nr:GT4 family glycosyltransferase PelF [Gammaproteobacteria bacterium]